MMLAIADALLLVGGICGALRVVIGPTLADRTMALDTVLAALMGMVAIGSVRAEREIDLTALVVIAVIGFTATLAASRYIERGDDQ